MSVSNQPLQPFDFGKQQLYTKQQGLWSQAFHRLARNRLALVAGCILATLLAVATAAQFVEAVQRHGPAEQQYTSVDDGPSGEFWLGTDNLGRDEWARLTDGTLLSLKIGFGAEAIVVILGLSVGMLAALMADSWVVM